MTLGICFWILMLLWFVFGLWSAWPFGPDSPKLVGGSFLLFVLLFILGWAVFGPPIHR